MQVTCKQCGSNMKRTTKGESNLGLQLAGVLLFLLGVFLLFLFPIGTFVGVFLMVGAARLGYKKRKLWVCDGCGYFFERVK